MRFLLPYKAGRNAGDKGVNTVFRHFLAVSGFNDIGEPFKVGKTHCGFMDR